MKIGILKELNLNIVSMIPETISKLKIPDSEVWVQSGAGLQSNFTDEQYQEVALLKSRDEILKNCDIIITIQIPPDEDLKLIQDGAILITNVEKFVNPDNLNKFKNVKFQVFSMDEIPRTTIAQSMDILSSMASLAGYKSVLLASNIYTRYIPMMITAAGSIKPSRVLVIGAGVAGLQAIATAKRLGAQVEAFDVRSASRQEVESLGAKFIEVEGALDDKAAGGYAVEQSEDFLRRQKEEVQKRAILSDIVITTAQIRGKKAPILITKDTVEKMKPGSVIVDLAASTGGNCELTSNNKTIVIHGVSIVGNSLLAYEMKQDASLLYGNNISNFLKYYLKQKENNNLQNDEIVNAVWVNKN